MKTTILILATLIPMTALAGTAYYKGEKVSGTNKICYYSYLGNDYAITIRSHEVCPVTIEVRD